ncbi:hypothetical protein OESDEN_19522 [Oesophagostomum dentatum]|uniref:SCP domain-containing protein n=1 Tax=Oesophagostomum dentatum TaxID=61180 RepID=A0A0B1S778_OESDE|nr:hypothetical protein OESDEN_19522 [Oesophagostomum dentatum]
MSSPINVSELEVHRPDYPRYDCQLEVSSYDAMSIRHESLDEAYYKGGLFWLDEISYNNLTEEEFDDWGPLVSRMDIQGFGCNVRDSESGSHRYFCLFNLSKPINFTFSE